MTTGEWSCLISFALDPLLCSEHKMKIYVSSGIRIRNHPRHVRKDVQNWSKNCLRNGTFFPQTSRSLLCVRVVAVAFLSKEVLWRRGPPWHIFSHPGSGYGRKTTTLVRDLEYFIDTKCHQTQFSSSGLEVENVNCLTDQPSGQRHCVSFWCDVEGFWFESRWRHIFSFGMFRSLLVPHNSAKPYKWNQALHWCTERKIIHKKDGGVVKR